MRRAAVEYDEISWLNLVSERPHRSRNPCCYSVCFWRVNPNKQFSFAWETHTLDEQTSDHAGTRPSRAHERAWPDDKKGSGYSLTGVAGRSTVGKSEHGVPTPTFVFWLN